MFVNEDMGALCGLPAWVTADVLERGGWGDVKTALVYLRGNQMDMLANNLIRGIQKGSLAGFYVDDRVLSSSRAAKGGRWGNAGERDFKEAIKALLEGFSPETPSECSTCDVESDLAYDANRERGR
jgi:hypothetical protein